MVQKLLKATLSESSRYNLRTVKRVKCNEYSKHRMFELHMNERLN